MVDRSEEIRSLERACGAVVPDGYREFLKSERESGLAVDAATERVWRVAMLPSHGARGAPVLTGDFLDTLYVLKLRKLGPPLDRSIAIADSDGDVACILPGHESVCIWIHDEGSVRSLGVGVAEWLEILRFDDVPRQEYDVPSDYVGVWKPVDSVELSHEIVDKLPTLVLDVGGGGTMRDPLFNEELDCVWRGAAHRLIRPRSASPA